MAKSYLECIEAIDSQTALIYANFGAPEEGVVAEIEKGSGVVEGRLRMTPSEEDVRTSFAVINFMTMDRSRSDGLYSYTVFPVGKLAVAQFGSIGLPKNEIRKARQNEETFARLLIAAGARRAPIRVLTVTGLRRVTEDFDRFTDKVLS